MIRVLTTGLYWFGEYMIDPDVAEAVRLSPNLTLATKLRFSELIVKPMIENCEKIVELLHSRTQIISRCNRTAARSQVHWNEQGTHSGRDEANVDSKIRKI